MTAARARGSQRVRSNSERGKDQLQGLQPVVEDWHAKVCLLGVHRRLSVDVILYLLYIFVHRSSGNDCTVLHQVWMLARSTNCGI